MDAEWRRRARFLSQIGVSGVVLVAGLYVVLSGSYPDDYVKWAFGVIGVVLGYWLR